MRKSSVWRTTPKQVNLRKSVEKLGVKYLNIFIKYGRMVRFELYMSKECAWNDHVKGECYTYSVKQACEKFPEYFAVY